MEDYKIRMKKEYVDLKERYVKLQKILVAHKSGTLDFELNCPISLLKRQAHVMKDYLDILEQRAIIEGVEL